MNLFDFIIYEQHAFPTEFWMFAWVFAMCVMWLPVIGAVLVFFHGWPTQHIVKVDAPKYPVYQIKGTLKDEYARSDMIAERFNKTIKNGTAWCFAHPKTMALLAAGLFVVWYVGVRK